MCVSLAREDQRIYWTLTVFPNGSQSVLFVYSVPRFDYFNPFLWSQFERVDSCYIRAEDRQQFLRGKSRNLESDVSRKLKIRETNKDESANDSCM